MKKAVIKITNEAWISSLNNLRNSLDFQVVGINERKLNRWNEYIDGYEIMSAFRVVKLYKEKKVDAVILPFGLRFELLNKMAQEFKILGMDEEDILIASPEFLNNPIASNVMKWKDYHCLPYLEFHVCDHCNLNCKSCVHFSPLVNGEVFADYDAVKRDLAQLNKIVEYIDEIHILGGEPLLNNQLPEYIKMVREIYPYTRLKIITNGLLLKTMNQYLVDTIRDNNAVIGISLYKPMFEHIEEILGMVTDMGIEVEWTEPIDKFAYTFDEDNNHLEGAKRINCACPNLYKGKLAVCPPIAYLDYFNEAFGKNYSKEGGLIDIYDEGLEYAQLVRLLHKPCELCKKCLFVSKEDCVDLPWEQAWVNQIEDYVC